MKKIGHRTLIALAVISCFVGFQFLNPNTRSDLGVANAEASQETCVPKFENYWDEFKNTNTPWPNYERVSNTFIPYAIASLNAYRKSKTFVLAHYDEGWTAIDPETLGIGVPQWNGFDLSLYVREDNPSIEILVAFRGTDELTVRERFAGLPDWLFGNLSWFTQWWLPWWDQYRSARLAFQNIRQWAQGKFGDRPVFYTLSGHSLGGGIAQHVAKAFPCTRAVVFNSSCVTNEFRLAAPFTEAQIILINEDDDPLTKVCKHFFEYRNDSSTQIYAGANMILKAEAWLDQHSMEQYSAGMSRMIVCCEQRNRLSMDKSCKCTDKIAEQSFRKARRLFCSERNRSSDDIACDFGSKWNERYKAEECVDQIRNC